MSHNLLHKLPSFIREAEQAGQLAKLARHLNY